MKPSQATLEFIYGSDSRPYYIYAPRWIDSSAGIKALHYFCHSLNQLGMKAYLVLCEPPFQDQPRINPHLLTPILTSEIADSHFRSDLNPIVVYSETIAGNPLGGAFCVRYLMNFIGVLGGPLDFPKDDYLLSFSRSIQIDTEAKLRRPVDSVLFIPPIDPREFQRNYEKKEYGLVYAGKYRSYIGKPDNHNSSHNVEIFRDGPRMQKRSRVKQLLSEAKILYIYENSSIATEAILSGTPVCVIPTEFTSRIIAEYELGNHGMAFTENENDITNARESIDLSIKTYYDCINSFQKNLEAFVEQTQLIAKGYSYNNIIQIPIFKSALTKHRVRLAYEIGSEKGLRTLLRVTYHFILRRLSWRFWMNKEKI